MAYSTSAFYSIVFNFIPFWQRQTNQPVTSMWLGSVYQFWGYGEIFFKGYQFGPSWHRATFIVSTGF